MAQTLIFLAGVAAGAIGALSIRSLLTDVARRRSPLPPETLRAIRHDRIARRPVLGRMPPNPHLVRPARDDFDFDMDQTRDLPD